MLEVRYSEEPTASQSQDSCSVEQHSHSPVTLIVEHRVLWTRLLVGVSVGIELLDWAMKEIDQQAMWTTEPAFTPPFSEGPEPLSGFLEYHAKRGKVKVSLECHNLTRSDKEGYKVSNTERVGFNLKDIYTIALCL